MPPNNCISLIPGKKIKKRRKPKKFHMTFRPVFPFIFELVLAIYVVSCRFVRRFWIFNDGNQLPGCRLFSSCDIYLFIKIYFQV